MAFIEKADLFTQILEDELNEIVRGNDTLITQAISSAISEVKSFLFDSYDTDVIFEATGANRHPLLIIYVADITVWFLSASCQAGINMDDRETRYKNAIRWLKMVKQQTNYPDLPVREATQQTHIKYGSNTKRNNYF